MTTTKPDALEILRDKPIGSDVYARSKPTSLLSGLSECRSAVLALGGPTVDERKAVAAYLHHAETKVANAIAALEAERREAPGREPESGKPWEDIARDYGTKIAIYQERDAKIRETISQEVARQLDAHNGHASLLLREALALLDGGAE